MADFPLLIGVIVLILLVVTLMVMVAFGLSDRVIFFAQLTFVASAGTAVWGAILRHPFTEYAVWMMYGTGLALAGLMVCRSHRKNKPASES